MDEEYSEYSGNHKSQVGIKSGRLKSRHAFFSSVTMATNPTDSQQQTSFSNLRHDETVLKQMEQISEEIARRFPLVDKTESVLNLKDEYKEDEVFLTKIDSVADAYSKFRRVRGDGNCFYRAYAYLLFECCKADTALYERTLPKLENTLKWLIDLGLPAFTTEDFYETFMDTLREYVTGAEKTEEDLLGVFNDDGMSNYLVVYVRLLVSGQLQHKADNYIHFVDGGYNTMKEFCDKEVMPVDKEADHLQVMAITECLEFPLKIIYVDRSPGPPTEIKFPDNSNPDVVLIYRPGHYDILYK